MTSKTIAERDRCIAEALPLKDSPGAGVGRRAAGLPAREDGALGNGSGAGLGANVPAPSLDAHFRAPNHHAGIKRQNRVSARAPIRFMGVMMSGFPILSPGSPCLACGHHRGADVRPLFESARMGS